MGIEDHLQQFLQDASHSGVERTDVVSRIEGLFDELSLQWEHDKDDSSVWRIKSDVGDVFATLDEDLAVLSFSQGINQISQTAKKNADLYEALLLSNSVSAGASYCLSESDGSERPWLVIIGRIAARKVDAEEIALTLISLFILSQQFD